MVEHCVGVTLLVRGRGGDVEAKSFGVHRHGGPYYNRVAQTSCTRSRIYWSIEYEVRKRKNQGVIGMLY